MKPFVALASGGIVLALLAGGIGVYAERGHIAESAARRWLADHGVASSAIEIEGLSRDGFTARLRLGAAGDPDLTVDRMVVHYDLSGPWSGAQLAINPRWVRLTGVHLNARLKRGALSLGAVDQVIRAIATLPPSKAPPPDVLLRDGEVRLFSDAGLVRMRFAGAFHPNAPSSLQGEIAPFRLSIGRSRLEGAGGVLDAASNRGRLTGHIALGQAAYVGESVSIGARRAEITAETPMPGGPGLWQGPASAGLEASGVTATRAGMSIAGADFTALLNGAVDIGADRASVRGDLRIASHAASLLGPGVRMLGPAIRGSISHVTLTRDAHGVVAQGAAEANLSVAAIVTAKGRLADVSSAMHTDRIDIRTAGPTTLVSGVVHGDVAARGSVDGPGGDGPYAEALQRALHDFNLTGSQWQAVLAGGAAAVQLPRPLVLTTTSGAHVELAGAARVTGLSPLTAIGAATFSVAGGGLPTLKAELTSGQLARGNVTADVSTTGALDLPPADGAMFALAGRMSTDGNGARFDLSKCAPVTARRLSFDPNPATNVSVRICPAAGPLILADDHGWRVKGRFDGLAGDMTGAGASLRDAAGSFGADGTRGGLSGATALVDRFQVVDTSASQRFRPIVGAGHVDVLQSEASGSFRLGTSEHPALATISLKHDLASGAGRLDIEARDVPFAPGALQPIDISALAAVARNARGPATFTGWFAWAPKTELRSGGEAIATGFGFDSPLGPIIGLDADIHFVSLAPLVTAPDQNLNLRQIQAVLPLSLLAAKFGLGAEHLSVTTASGAMASGHIRLEPMKIQLAPDASFEGAIVLDHVNLGEILAATNLSDTVTTSAVVDGRIPFKVGPHGVTIQQGHLAAIGPGRVSISRKALSGAAKGPADQPGFAQDLAYQAMENLAFDQMDASINSQPHDRLGMLFHIRGRHDPPTRQKATLAVKDVLSGHAMDKPMMLPSDTKIDLTLDTSLNFGDLVEALGQTWRDALSSNREAARSAQVQRSNDKGVRP